MLSGAAIGLACPANAALDAGTYKMKITSTNQPRDFKVGSGQYWNAEDCGQDCRHVTIPNGDVPYDFQRSGSTWTAVNPNPPVGPGFTVTVDDNSLAGSMAYADGAQFGFQLTRN